MSRKSIRFLRRGEVVEVSDIEPNETLLDYLRLRENRCGTKEGCAEGDCGACTVALGVLRDGRVNYEPVNSCVHLLGMVDGKEVVTVEDLATSSGELHPVQQAMVSNHGSQCGFCTPGLVMSLFTLYHNGTSPTRPAIDDWLAGNLCRCTGYKPIVDAALQSCDGMVDDQFSKRSKCTVQTLATLQDDVDVFAGTSDCFFAAPATLRSLATLYEDYSKATLVAGATDVGLWVTKQLQVLPQVIHMGRVEGLDGVHVDATEVVIGAATTYEQAHQALGELDPDVAEVVRRLGSKQIRSVATVGGNIANGSPIGDCAPMLIALDATLELRKGATYRELPLERFFLDYGRQDRAPGEFITQFRVPRLTRAQRFRCYKISKRFDQDISAVLGAFRFTIDGGRISEPRVAFGGMAATPKRALETENALQGLRLDAEQAWDAACAALAQDFQPIGDMRASARYRLRTAAALLRKALLECAGTPSVSTRVVGCRPAETEHAQ